MKTFSKNESIICPYCGVESEHDAIDYVSGYLSLTGERIFSTLVEEQVCENCGEGFLTRLVNDTVLVANNWSSAPLYAIKNDQTT